MRALVHKYSACAAALIPASDLAHKNLRGFTALHACVTIAAEECFELLLPHVSDMDVRTVAGEEGGVPDNRPFNLTALHLACAAGSQPIVKALLKRGASPTAKDSEQRMPLFYAVENGNLSCVILLIGRPGNVKMPPAQVSEPDARGVTALHFAADNGWDRICGVLLEAGARRDAKLDGWTPLMIARHRHPANAALHALLCEGGGGGPARLPGTVCDHCGKSAEEAAVPFLKSCGSCYGMRYCGAACSAAAWPAHKAACKTAKAERERATTLRRVDVPVKAP